MSTEKWPFSDPRVAGMREHLTRVQMFLGLGRKSTHPDERFRFFIAGIYFARGIVELMFEAADKDQICDTRDDLKKALQKKLPKFSLIEKIRIHDFHRFGLIPPDPNVKLNMQRGPVKIRACEGAATCTIAHEGPQLQLTGKSKVEEQRPLLSDDGKFFDDDTREYVSIEDILDGFAAAASTVVDEFEKKLR